MEGPYITLKVEEHHKPEESEDNGFKHFMQSLSQKGEEQLASVLRPLSADSSKARYVINQALLMRGLGWGGLLNIIDEDTLKQELCGQILLFWSDRSDEENSERVDAFIKKVADIA